MFERFTERARRVVVYAQEEATELNHGYIGTEHLLLGLMRDTGSVAAQALRELEIGQDAVLEFSLREALQLNHSYIGTEHILLGVVREGEGAAAQVLSELGGSLSRVRDKVIELAPAGTGEGPELSSQPRRPGLRGPLDTFLRRLEAVEERLAAIERHLGLPGGAAATGPGGGAPPGSGAEPGGGGQEPGGGEQEPDGGEQEPGGGKEPGGGQAGGAGR
jgi:ATP-dependent Clp protease ATP-binding subunit ClpA